jgi:hypothetical protein
MDLHWKVERYPAQVPATSSAQGLKLELLASMALACLLLEHLWKTGCALG